MAKNFEKFIFGGLHEKHAVQRGIWVPTQHLLWDQGKPRANTNHWTSLFLADRTEQMSTSPLPTDGNILFPKRHVP
jgi:hypothetical protein